MVILETKDETLSVSPLFATMIEKQFPKLKETPHMEVLVFLSQQMSLAY
jgi:hypothetical protein